MELTSGQLFINSELVGDTVSIRLPGFDGVEEETTIHYLEAGNGEPLLLIHGIGQSLYTWRHLFSELSDHYRVIMIDLIGHGYSGRPDSFNYSMDAVARSIALFMDQKGIESAHMVGFSTGAMYMLRFLTLYHERVANCIAISPGGITESMPRLIHRIKRPLLSVFSRNLFTATDVRRILEDCVEDEDVVDDRMVRQYYQPLSDGLSREALMYSLRNFDLNTVWEDLVDLDHEVLVVWGKEDEWHSPRESRRIKNMLLNGRYYLIKNAGHLVHEERPDKILDLIFSYIPPVASEPEYRMEKPRFVDDEPAYGRDERYGDERDRAYGEDERYGDERYDDDRDRAYDGDDDDTNERDAHGYDEDLGFDQDAPRYDAEEPPAEDEA